MDARNYSQTAYDIYFSFSSNGGDSFSPNVRVNDLLGMEDAWQWNPTICVNDSGRVFVAWQDGRNHPLNPDIYSATGQYVGIEEFMKQKTTGDCIQVFPNPFQDFLNLQSQGGEIKQLKIFDVSGRCVKNSGLVIDRQVNLGVNDLPGGVYFVKVWVGNHVIIRKVIKIK